MLICAVSFVAGESVFVGFVGDNWNWRFARVCSAGDDDDEDVSLKNLYFSFFVSFGIWRGGGLSLIHI